MKRQLSFFLLGIIATCAIGATVLKQVNGTTLFQAEGGVSNPLTEALNGGGHDIINFNDFLVTNSIVVGDLSAGATRINQFEIWTGSIELTNIDQSASFLGGWYVDIGATLGADRYGGLVMTNIVSTTLNASLTGSFTVDATDFVLGTLYTNGIYRATISASFTLNAAAAGTAKVTMYVKSQDTTLIKKLSISSGPLASLTVTDTLSLRVGPGEVFSFVDEKSGTGATDSVVSGTCSVTTE